MKKWLKNIRESKGYTQESLAEEIGVAKTTYASYEQGHRQPSIINAKKIATKLDMPWTIFFDDEVLKTYYFDKEVAK